ncbi:MAG: peptidoglycan-binding protein [Acutalibacteraceae bacterium]
MCGKSDRDILYSSSAPKYTEEEKAEATVTTYKTGDYDNNVVSIQERLNELNYLDMAPTGYFGDLTSEALTNFQNANGIMDTGYADSFTQSVLFSEGAVENPNPENVVTDSSEETASTEASISETVAETYEATEGTVKTNELSKKALSNLTSDGSFENVSQEMANPFGFVKWLIVVLVIMGVAFGIVFGFRKHSFKNARHTYNNRKYW